MKLKHIFYRREIKDNVKITHILGLKFKRKLSPLSAIEQFFVFPPFPVRNLISTPFPATLSTEQCNIDPSQIGKWSYTQRDLWVASSQTTIGAFCSIACRVILGHGKHPIHFLSTSPFLYFDELGYKTKKMPSHSGFWKPEPVTIGNDVWIGDGVFVRNGVHIGDGAIIGARAVVTKDVPPYAIVVGCPAQIIKYRFTPPVIEELLKLKWWELADDIIQQIPYDDIPKALKFLHQVRSAQ